MKQKTLDTMKMIERRHFIRHSMCFPLKYKIIEKESDKAGRHIPSSTINVSRGGLLFSSKHPVDINTKISVQLPFQNKVFNVKAKVVHCNKSPETGLYNIGVCFYRYRDAFKIKLIEQMYLIIEYRDLRSIEIGKEMPLRKASEEWIKRYSERFKRLYW